MQTILGGMSKLSLVAQRNIFFRNVFDKNEELLKLAQKEIKADRQDGCHADVCQNEDEARVFLVMTTDPLRF